jgi:hypothetical protein
VTGSEGSGAGSLVCGADSAGAGDSCAGCDSEAGGDACSAPDEDSEGGAVSGELGWTGVGGCAGGASGWLDVVAGRPPERAFDAADRGWCFRPGFARAATAANSPVRVRLPAISQRFARLSERSAASRVCVVWAFTCN